VAIPLAQMGTRTAAHLVVDGTHGATHVSHVVVDGTHGATHLVVDGAESSAASGVKGVASATIPACHMISPGLRDAFSVRTALAAKAKATLPVNGTPRGASDARAMVSGMILPCLTTRLHTRSASSASRATFAMILDAPKAGLVNPAAA